MKFKSLLIIFLFFSNLLFSKELEKVIYLPLIKNHGDKKICYIFSSLTGKLISKFECQDIGKQSKDLIPLKSGGKWGFINSLGEWVITPEFDFVDNFYSDFARVQKNNKYGFIDKNGKVVIEIKFPYVGNFFEGENYAPFQCNEVNNYLYGYIDKKGNVIIPCEYQMAYDVRNNIARVRKWDLYGFISYDNKNKIKKILQNFSFRLAGDFGNHIAYVLKNDSFYYILSNGKEIKKLNDNYIPGNFSITDPLADFQDLNSGYYGYFDTNFEVRILPMFLEAHEFFLGYAKVIGPIDYHDTHYDLNLLLIRYKEKKYEEFYIDTTGKRITYWD